MSWCENSIPGSANDHEIFHDGKGTIRRRQAYCRGRMNRWGPVITWNDGNHPPGLSEWIRAFGLHFMRVILPGGVLSSPR